MAFTDQQRFPQDHSDPPEHACARILIPNGLKLLALAPAR
jgi:hypothetical protein